MKPDFDTYVAFRLTTDAARHSNGSRPKRAAAGAFVVTVILAVVAIAILI